MAAGLLDSQAGVGTRKREGETFAEMTKDELRPRVTVEDARQHAVGRSAALTKSEVGDAHSHDVLAGFPREAPAQRSECYNEVANVDAPCGCSICQQCSHSI